MRFELSQERRQFAGSLHDLLAAADLPSVARHWAVGRQDRGLDLWRRLGDLGATALAVPEEFGGLAAHPVDIAVAFEELGHHAVPGPLVESLAVVPTLLTGLGPGGGDLARRWLPGLAEGKNVATVAFPPHLPYALDADSAHLVLLVDGDAVRLAGGGDQMSSVDATRHLFSLTGGKAVASGVDTKQAAANAFDVGVLACTAQLLGAGRALLEMSTDYAKQRAQFGRPIGSFQAVKHQLADVHVGLELARPLLFAAAIAMADRDPTVSRDVSAAKVAASGAAYRAARVALQVHGALGYTGEYDLGLCLTKIRALKGAWGTDQVHRARVMAALSQRGEDGR